MTPTTGTVTVALVGDPANPGIDWDGDLHERWDERPKVELDVRSSDPLGLIIDRAAETFEAKNPYGSPAQLAAYVDFHRPGEKVTPRNELTLVDARGHVRWDWIWRDVRYEEVVRAAEAGALDGDPERLYFIVQGGIGDGVMADWPALMEAWQVLLDILDTLGLAYAAKKLVVDQLRKRFRHAPEAIESHYDAWKEQGGRPRNFTEFIGKRNWHPEDLARLLGCGVEEAEAMLIGYGHTRSQSGLWRPGDDEAAKFMAGNTEIAINGAVWRREDLREVLEQRAREFLETGSAPKLNWERWVHEHKEDRSRLKALGVMYVEEMPRLDRLRQRLQQSVLWRIDRYRWKVKERRRERRVRERGRGKKLD